MDLLTVETLDRPADDDEVRALLPQLGPDRALLGGGTFLFSVPQPHLRGLVDLTAAGWTAQRYWRENLDLASEAMPAHTHSAKNQMDDADVRRVLQLQNPPSYIWVEH